MLPMGQLGVHDLSVILHLLDASMGPTRADDGIVAAFPQGVPVLRIWNKIDLSGHKPAVDVAEDATHIYLSAHEHVGMDLLRKELLRIAGWQQTGESVYLARERHLIALRSARQHLASAGAHAAQVARTVAVAALQADLLLLLGRELGRIAEGVAAMRVADPIAVLGPRVLETQEGAHGVRALGQLLEQRATLGLAGRLLIALLLLPATEQPWLPVLSCIPRDPCGALAA